MMVLCTWEGFTPTLRAIWFFALLWSNRVRAVKFSRGIEGAQDIAINALVLAGLPTTRTFNIKYEYYTDFGCIYLYMAGSIVVQSFSLLSEDSCIFRQKVLPFHPISLQCWIMLISVARKTYLRGKDPTKMATSTPVNASFTSVVATTVFNKGKAPSSTSNSTPSNTCFIGGMSSKCRISSCRGPKTPPDAIMNTRE